jgi:hypothetical protein
VMVMMMVIMMIILMMMIYTYIYTSSLQAINTLVFAVSSYAIRLTLVVDWVARSAFRLLPVS